MLDYLFDNDFLKLLCKTQIRETFARVIALTLDENPIENLEGKITTGNISINGNSAIRRTCSLTFIVDNIDKLNYEWALNTKIKVEIGIRNTTKYYSNHKIIWFPMGIYFLTSFNTSLGTSNLTVSIQGKDKMCGLSGDIGGKMTSIVNFGEERYTNTKTK